MNNKTCVICGKEYQTTAPNTLTCSPACTATRHRQTTQAYYLKNEARNPNAKETENQNIKKIILQAWQKETDPIVRKNIEHRNPDISFVI